MVVGIAGSGGFCCVPSFSSAWSQSESTDLVSAVQYSQEVADIGGMSQSIETRGDRGKRSETLRGGLETGPGGQGRRCAGARAASLDVELESGQVLGPKLGPVMLG